MTVLRECVKIYTNKQFTGGSNVFNIKDLPEELKKYAAVQNLFELYRIVDPDTHRVYDYKASALSGIDGKCYDIWKRNGPCANCISKQTCANNRLYLKLEHLDNSVFIIYSVPVEIQGKRYSLELVKDATCALLVNNAVDGNMEIMSLVNQFNEVVSHDTFTGLFNKNYIKNQIECFLSGDLPKISRYCGAIADLNDFKRVNDVFGHYTGDLVLQAVSDGFKEFCIQNGNVWAARLGGDEFFIGFIDWSVEDVRAVCEVLRGKIAAKTFTKDKVGFSVTAEFGADEIRKSDTMAAFLDRVDKRMYERKAKSKAAATAVKSATE